jgi:hypothetical protein
MSREAKGVRKLMKKNYFCIALGALLLALSVRADAQQTKQVPRIGYVSNSGDANNPGPLYRHSGKDFGISVISREKTFWLSFAPLKESWTVSQALWPNSFNAR